MADTPVLHPKDERHIRKMFADREYYGAANDAIPLLLNEVDRLRAVLEVIASTDLACNEKHCLLAREALGRYKDT